MQKSDKKEFGILLTGLSEVFNQPLTTAGVGIYWQILKPYTLAEVEKAIFKLVASNTFMPKVGEIVETISGKTKNQGQAAWGDFMGLLYKYGGLRNKSLEVNSAMAETVNRLGGWAYLARKTQWELNSLERSFIAIYECLGVTMHNATSELIGTAERDWRTQKMLPITKIKLNKQLVTFTGNFEILETAENMGRRDE